MLMRFDPFRHVDPFRELDRALTAAGGSAAPSMPMDAVRRDHEIELRFDLPGVDATSIDVEVDGDELRVSAERRRPAVEGERVLSAERRFGRMGRRVLLGEHLDSDGVAASYVDGVLVVTIPIAEQATPRKVLVATGAGRTDAIDVAEAPSADGA